jgi:hypothetical protein
MSQLAPQVPHQELFQELLTYRTADRKAPVHRVKTAEKQNLMTCLLAKCGNWGLTVRPKQPRYTRHLMDCGDPGRLSKQVALVVGERFPLGTSNETGDCRMNIRHQIRFKGDSPAQVPIA